MQDIAPKQKPEQFIESLVLWKSDYLDHYQKERIFLNSIYPELQKIVRNALKASRIFVDKQDQKDALQEGYINAYLFMNRNNLLKYKDPRPAIFLAVKGGIIDYLKSIINQRVFTGEIFKIAVEKGYSFESTNLKATPEGELKYPVFQDPSEQEQLIDIFESIFSVKLYKALKNEWSDKDQIYQLDKDWRKFFGVDERNYGSKFHGSVLRKAVREYNSLLDEHISIKKHFGKNQKIEAYTLNIRNKPDTPRLNLMYSEKLYEYFKDKAGREIRLMPDELRKILQVQSPSYNDNAILNNRIIKRSIEEINNKTNMEIYYELERGGKRSVSIKAFLFYVEHNKNTNES